MCKTGGKQIYNTQMIDISNRVRTAGSGRMKRYYTISLIEDAHDREVQSSCT